MGEDKLCTCEAEKHQDHICMLKNKGLTHKIKQLTSNPNVTCLACGELANSEDNVCAPATLFI
jgi:hypothetical protein